eukprot:3774444-Rhodomonas_salina.1
MRGADGVHVSRAAWHGVMAIRCRALTTRAGGGGRWQIPGIATPMLMMWGTGDEVVSLKAMSGTGIGDVLLLRAPCPVQCWHHDPNGVRGTAT